MLHFQDLDVLKRDPDAIAGLADARHIEFVLEEGEVLFLPQGTPHQVQNLTFTVAVTSNMFDQSNVRDTLHQTHMKLKHVGKEGSWFEQTEALCRGLGDSVWPEIEDDLASGDDTLRSGEELVGLFPLHAR